MTALILVVGVAAIAVGVELRIKKKAEREAPVVEEPAEIGIEIVNIPSMGENVYRSWDLETGIVCYFRGIKQKNGAILPDTPQLGCAHTPLKPYPLRKD